MASLKTAIMRWPSPVVATSRNTTTHLLRQSTTTTPKLFMATTARPIHINATANTLLPKTRSTTTTISNARPFCTTHQVRNAKSPASADLAADAKAAREAASSLSQGNASASQGPPLDWNTFFTLRTRRRRIQLAFSAISTIAGITSGAAILTSGLAEPLIAQVPLDPFFTLGILVFACGGLGWLIGPSLGSQVFYLRNFRVKGQIQLKEAEFFARVKRYRVDPSNSSYGNPVPDFYGEKISSVAGYRQWLKDQRAFNRKKTKDML